MADSSAVVQAALIAKYRGDATLQALMVSASAPEWNIFDQGGAGELIASFPYVYVHPLTAQLGEAFAMQTDSMDVLMQVNVFTRAQGFAQARAMIGRLYQLTHGPVAGALSLPGFTNVLTLFDNRQELEEVTDGLVQHIADRYKVCTQG